MGNFFRKLNLSEKTPLALLFLVLLVVIVILGFNYKIVRNELEKYRNSIPYPDSSPKVQSLAMEGFKKFASESEFKAYIKEALLTGGGGYGYGIGGDVMTEEAMPPGMGDAKSISEPDRVSGTNVQVIGIDEPDIVKTNGEEIFFSGEDFYVRGLEEREMIMPPEGFGKTRIINAFPPADLSVAKTIDERGEMLLHNDTLILFSGGGVKGYDVSSPQSPEKTWTVQLGENNAITASRLYDGSLYIITREQINVPRPCPMEPLIINEKALEVLCTDVYHPVNAIPTDITYHAFKINPLSGEVENSISFTGSSGSQIVYMSKSSIYVTYTYNESMVAFYSGFFRERCGDLFPASFIERIKTLESYDLSESAEMAELMVLVEQQKMTLSSDERIKIENEIQERIGDYYREHMREFEQTGIVKISIGGLTVSATGSIPGHPLNQFSLDEYENHLRIATTMSSIWGMMGNAGESANDVYVLGEDLSVKGSVKNLGITESIYSARFVGDKGYIVTFRQTDPFYVLDLSQPEKPALAGELKIPGYSSYLHPVTSDIMLGTGMEGSQVKVSLFDVSSPENPRELDKNILNEYWSEILNTHHAFLLDAKHQVFFLPGTSGGYVFSYQNSRLELKKTISGIAAKRALYINDYLYIIGEDKVSVLDENNWEVVKELNL